MRRFLTVALVVLLAASCSMPAWAQSRVAVADSTHNRLTQHVIGNKADAAATTAASTKSLVAYLKGIISLFGAATATTTDSLHGKIGTDAEMADSSLYDMLGPNTAATTDSINGKLGTDAALSDSSLYDMLGANTAATSDSINGKLGTDAEFNDVSLYDMVGANTATTTDSINGKLGTDTEMGDTSIFDYLMPVEVTGTTDVDISEADYTTYITILTIVPATGQSLIDLVIDLDYNKASTGLDTVATAADTIDVSVVTKVDGTNWRHVMSGTQVTANGDGSLENNEDGERFKVGMVGINGEIIVRIKLSIERDDAEIPYRVIYRGAAPTITAVAAA